MASFKSIHVIFLVLLTMNIFFFGGELRPDEIKSIDIFSELILGSRVTYWGEIYLRVFLFVSCFLLLITLLGLNLVNIKTYSLAIIWPSLIFLQTKIYWEFFVYPLILIRTDLSPRVELTLISALTFLFFITLEGNLIVFIAYRTILLFQKVGFKHLAPLSFLAVCILLSLMMEYQLYTWNSYVEIIFSRFEWTRNTVNPEYSVLESLVVFISSMHFFTQHDLLWYVDLLFSVIVVAMIFDLSIQKLTGFLFRLETLAFLCVFLGMTEITHAFQNARYYMFFIPILASVISNEKLPLLGLLGVLHMSTKIIENSIT